jgi:hypothetical protein
MKEPNYIAEIETIARNTGCYAHELFTPIGWVKARITGTGRIVWFVNDVRTARATIVRKLMAGPHYA